MVKEKPILFSGTMVRAILAGKKTATRRIIDPQPVFDGYWWSHNKYSVNCEQTFREGLPFFGGCKFGVKGDQLWVREAWAPLSTFDPEDPGLLYRADHHAGLEKKNGDQKWKPSIHMKRTDSRITLEITNVRVERLNDISEADAIAEGIVIDPEESRHNGRDVWSDTVSGKCYSNPVSAYRGLWAKINGPDSWSLNPWVWIVEFQAIPHRPV